MPRESDTKSKTSRSISRGRAPKRSRELYQEELKRLGDLNEAELAEAIKSAGALYRVTDVIAKRVERAANTKPRF